MKIKTMPGKQRISAMAQGKYEAAMAGWAPDYADPLTFLETMTSENPQNTSHWKNKEFDQLIKDANGTLLTRLEERDRALKDAEELLLNDAAIAPIYQMGGTKLINPQVKNI